MGSDVLAIVPARQGSKGIPRKNVRDFGGRPLVAHAIETSREATLVNEIALTTDDRELAQIGKQYGADTIIDRPARLGADDVPLAPVVEHAYDAVDRDFDYVLCFQPTVPLIEVSTVDGGIEAGLDEQANSVIFVRDSTHNYWTVNDGQYVPVIQGRKNRQEMDPIYEEIGVFFTHSDLVQQGKRIGDSPSFHEVSHTEGIDIDTYGDWLLAESEQQRSSLVYRLTGNDQTGTGHIYRGITIADHLFEHDIVFVVGPTDDLAIEKLDRVHYGYAVCEHDEQFLEYVQATQPDVVVNDILDTTEEYMSEITELGPRVVNIEDLGSGTSEADAVINALYEHSDPPPNHYFGFKYFCLRNEFRYADVCTDLSSVDRIMISFGGTDENNLTAKALRALAGLEEHVYIDVVLGVGYTQRDSLDAVLEQYPTHLDVSITQDIDYISRRMEQADLLLTSNGRTLYEAASLNLPAISIAQNHREQKHPYAHISRGILLLGHAEYVTEQNIRVAVEDYIHDENKRSTMRDALAEHDISKGVDRIKAILFENQ